MMRHFVILGIVSATIAWPFVVTSVAFSPWFDIYRNALSDLGNITQHGSTAFIYNYGLIVSGSLVVSFDTVLSIRHASWKYLVWTIPLGATGMDLALIGIFTEDAGGTHSLVSVIFFVLIAITMLIYSYSSRSLASPRIGALALAFGIASPLIWIVEWPWHGVAIQEALTAMMMTIWLIVVSLRHA